MDPISHLSLLTDLYQLTMAQSYLQAGRIEGATFSLSVRSYPSNRSYFVAAGLEDVLDYLEGFEFDSGDIDYLRSTRLFCDEFLDFLGTLRFTGEVRAIPEGRLFFQDEPILEITAPIIEAQIVETFIINQIHLQTLITTKASRCVHAAEGRQVVDFALRRTHGTDAGMKVARSSYLAGFSGTSNVLAGKKYGIPIVGTMAHSFVMSFESEVDAFRSYVASFPDHSILLIDTYDVLTGARNAARIGRELAAQGRALRGVRIDSGDLATLAVAVRAVLDDAGLRDVKIIGSGGLDEFDLADFSAAHVPYDSYGVGTKMGVSADAPSLDIAYKLVEHQDRPVLKLSAGKISSPGRKQVFRFADRQGRFVRDVIALGDEKMPGAEPLLKKFMEKGRPIARYPSLQEIRDYFRVEFEHLDDRVKEIRGPALYPVEPSVELRQLQEKLQRDARSR